MTHILKLMLKQIESHSNKYISFIRELILYGLFITMNL